MIAKKVYNHLLKKENPIGQIKNKVKLPFNKIKLSIKHFFLNFFIGFKYFSVIFINYINIIYVMGIE